MKVRPGLYSMKRTDHVAPGASGVTLDPMQVVGSLAADMPLAYASDIFARMLRERLHRHRQALILRNLHRSCNLTAAAERAEVSPWASTGSSVLVLCDLRRHEDLCFARHRNH